MSSGRKNGLDLLEVLLRRWIRGGSSIEPGKLADLVAVSGDSLFDIRNIEKLAYVIKEGKVYRKP